MDPNENREWLTPRQTAEWLQISMPTLWRWVDTGKIPAVRLSKKSIRFHRSTVENKLNKTRPPR